jgi:biopolymer transport protein ExbD
MGAIFTNETGGDGEEAMAAINVTSLIDVMTCLLIGFMVSTPLASQEAVEIDIPHSAGIKITEEEFEYMVISIDAAGRVFLGSLPLDADKAAWSEQLAANAKLKKDGRAFLQGDRNAPFERILDVMLALREAGVSEVGFVTDPKPPDE